MTTSLALASWPATSLVGVDMTDTLNATWEAIRHQDPDVPRAQVSIVRGKGSPHWRPDQRVVHVAESTVNAGAPEILHFLLHQAAHDLVSEVPTGSQGRYHSVAYKTAAERLGLAVEYVGPKGGQPGGNGWARTSLTAEVQVIYAPQLRQLESAREHWEVPERQTSHRVTVHCQCTPNPRKLQIVPSVLDKGLITCEVCGQPFAA